MAARLFQSILLEVKDNVDFILGVVDNTGVITACTELKFIGESIEAAVEFFKMGLEEGQVGGYTFHMIGGYEAGAENAVFAGSIGERATLVCALTAVAIKNSKTQYDEKHDKVTFIKKIILDNILPGDIYIKSREMHFVSDCKRCCPACAWRTGRMPPSWKHWSSSSPTGRRISSSPSVKAKSL